MPDQPSATGARSTSILNFLVRVLLIGLELVLIAGSPVISLRFVEILLVVSSVRRGNCRKIIELEVHNVVLRLSDYRFGGRNL